MAELGLMAEAGAVGFANGSRTIMDSLVMRRVLAYCGMLDRPYIQHCEDHNLTTGSEMNESETSTRLGLIGAPAAAEAMIIDRDLHLVRMTGARYHAAHISTAEAVESIRRAKAEGLAVTADTAPPYFLLNELSVSTYDTAFKMAPPLRSEDDRQALIEGLAAGTLDAMPSSGCLEVVGAVRGVYPRGLAAGSSPRQSWARRSARRGGCPAPAPTESHTVRER